MDLHPTFCGKSIVLLGMNACSPFASSFPSIGRHHKRTIESNKVPVGSCARNFSLESLQLHPFQDSAALSPLPAAYFLHGGDFCSNIGPNQSAAANIKSKFWIPLQFFCPFSSRTSTTFNYIPFKVDLLFPGTCVVPCSCCCTRSLMAISAVMLDRGRETEGGF